MRTVFTRHKRAIMVSIGVLILLTPAYYFYQKYASLELMLKNPAAARQSELKSIIDRVGKHIQLPKNETPELVTVSNKDKVRDLPFFKNAANGDKVLLYKNAKMAYLYRPGTDQLINAAPIVDPGAGVAAPQSTPAQVTPSAVKVIVYNGTTIAGYGREVGDSVKKAYPTAEIASVSNAGEQTYKKTIVIDVSGKNAEAAKAIAQALGAQVTQLPPMEARPNSDILVIAGK
ncbi:LytR C-terminal domain-containing protein [Candidatus Microgenomates bacterium]|nr:LytR C-terminal domain-containing protein [Candidatus Microgenomates bacterium]